MDHSHDEEKSKMNKKFAHEEADLEVSNVYHGRLEHNTLLCSQRMPAKIIEKRVPKLVQ
jgi:hypothetical protein